MIGLQKNLDSRQEVRHAKDDLPIFLDSLIAVIQVHGEDPCFLEPLTKDIKERLAPASGVLSAVGKRGILAVESAASSKSEVASKSPTRWPARA